MRLLVVLGLAVISAITCAQNIRTANGTLIMEVGGATMTFAAAPSLGCTSSPSIVYQPDLVAALSGVQGTLAPQIAASASSITALATGAASLSTQIAAAATAVSAATAANGALATQVAMVSSSVEAKVNQSLLTTAALLGAQMAAVQQAVTSQMVGIGTGASTALQMAQAASGNALATGVSMALLNSGQASLATAASSASITTSSAINGLVASMSQVISSINSTNMALSTAQSTTAAVSAAVQSSGSLLAGAIALLNSSLLSAQAQNANATQSLNSTLTASISQAAAATYAAGFQAAASQTAGAAASLNMTLQSQLSIALASNAALSTALAASTSTVAALRTCAAQGLVLAPSGTCVAANATILSATSSCTSGAVRTNAGGWVDACLAGAWQPLAVQLGGISPIQTAYQSCLGIKTAYPNAPDGFYVVSGAVISVSQLLVYCDMFTEGGGWTLFATKVTPTFLFNAQTATAASFSTVAADMAGMIPPAATWTSVLFRFRNAGMAPAYTVYNKGGAAAFDSFLQGVSGTDQNGVAVPNFYRYDPLRGGRIPSTGTSSITSFYFSYGSGISEMHQSGSDVWVDLWGSSLDTTVSYYVSDVAANGDKCIAGYCFLKEPVWLMYR
eukprot:m.90341 g.90341  ORF g.90341 m.90341 type:complete len:621 (+) comp8458_c0_seq1:11-1873(+)